MGYMTADSIRQTLLPSLPSRFDLHTIEQQVRGVRQQSSGLRRACMQRLDVNWTRSRLHHVSTISSDLVGDAMVREARTDQLSVVRVEFSTWYKPICMA